MQMVYSLFATLNKSLRTSLETEFQLISTILDKTKRTFSPYCALSNAAKPFPKQHTCPKQRLSRKKFPFLKSLLLPTNAQRSDFLLKTQQHCFQGDGEREESVQLRCSEKCSPSMQFSQKFCPRL